MPVHLILLLAALMTPIDEVSGVLNRPRLAVLTDIGSDPDDQQSLIRLMAYADSFEIEALIATRSGKRDGKAPTSVRPDLIHEILDAYAQVLPHLRAHSDRFPDAAALKRSVRTGNPQAGRAHVGAGQATDASRFLIERIDAGTPQSPLNITIWGGQTDLAQALWDVRRERGPEGLRTFVARFRVYDVADQDDLADWLRVTFPGMRYILAKAGPGQDKRRGTFRGMYLTGDESLTSRDWVERHVRSRGPLGGLYPLETWTAPNPHGCLKEGDTPSWFFFLPQGGNDPDDPTQPGWGGQFTRADDGWYVDLPPSRGIDPPTTVSRWRPDYQRDFARRMQWCQPLEP